MKRLATSLLATCLILAACDLLGWADPPAASQPKSAKTVDELVKDLRNPNILVAFAAADALAKEAAHNNTVLARLTGLLGDEDPSVQFTVVRALVNTGKAAVPSLVLVSHSDNPKTRAQAADALGQMRRAGMAGVPRLMELLSDKDLSVRLSAAYSLYLLHQPADAFLPVLTDGLKDRTTRAPRPARGSPCIKG